MSTLPTPGPPGEEGALFLGSAGCKLPTGPHCGVGSRDLARGPLRRLHPSQGLSSPQLLTPEGLDLIKLQPPLWGPGRTLHSNRTDPERGNSGSASGAASQLTWRQPSTRLKRTLQSLPVGATAVSALTAANQGLLPAEFWLPGACPSGGTLGEPVGSSRSWAGRLAHTEGPAHCLRAEQGRRGLAPRCPSFHYFKQLLLLKNSGLQWACGLRSTGRKVASYKGRCRRQALLVKMAGRTLPGSPSLVWSVSCWCEGSTNLCSSHGQDPLQAQEAAPNQHHRQF